MFESSDSAKRKDIFITDCTDSESVESWYHREVASIQVQHHALLQQSLKREDALREECLAQELPQDMADALIAHTLEGERARLREELRGRMAVLRSLCRGRIAALSNDLNASQSPGISEE